MVLEHILYSYFEIGVHVFHDLGAYFVFAFVFWNSCLCFPWSWNIFWGVTHSYNSSINRWGILIYPNGKAKYHLSCKRPTNAVLFAFQQGCWEKSWYCTFITEHAAKVLSSKWTSGDQPNNERKGHHPVITYSWRQSSRTVLVWRHSLRSSAGLAAVAALVARRAVSKKSIPEEDSFYLIG